MSKYTPSFIEFSKDKMKIQGDLIRKLTNDLDPELAECCRDVIKAAGAET